MSRRLREERGFTLVEVLIVCLVSTIIFTATMAAFTSVFRQNRAVETQRDNVDGARLALDRATRQLRNLANPTYNATATIFRATDYDFIFQTSDPAKTWVRYCLDTTSAGASAANAKLWMAESKDAALSGGMSGGCPGSGWSRAQIVSQHVTNVTGGADRNIFTYACAPGSPLPCPAAGGGDFSKITTVGAQLFLDANPTDRVREMSVATSVYLRNQNQAPTAIINEPYAVLGPHRVSLNGSRSTDPEGRTLDLFWFVDSAPPAAELADCTKQPPSSAWAGTLYIKDFGPTEVGKTHNVWLVVRDPGCLTSTYGPVTVTVPS